MSSDLPILPDGWSYIPLEQLAQKGSVTYGVVQPGVAVESGVPIVRVNNFRDGRIELADVMRIAADVERKYARTRLHGGEVLITIVGSVGQVAVVPSNLKGFNVARAVAVIQPNEGVESEWLALCLRSPLSQQLLASRANTTVQTTINLKDLRELPIPMPSLQERKRIAATLGAIDDRIALLRESNATLESIAQALFKSWFVDFDPVRAMAEGRPHEGMGAATADLFPDSLEESAQGFVPKGWRFSRIGQQLKTILGGTPSRARTEYWTEGIIPWINSGKTNEFRIIRPSEFITQEAMNNSAAKLIPARTVVLAITGATLGQVSIVEIACCANQSVVAVIQDDHLPTEYIYFWILYMMPVLISSQTGGAQQHINKGNVDELAILVPSPQVMKRYSEVVRPIFDKIAVNTFNVESLSQARDILLPRLISGQLRLPQAVKELQEVMA